MGLFSNLINRISGNTNTAATNTSNKTAAGASSASTTKANTNSNKTLWQRVSDWANTGNTNVDAAGYSYGAEGPSYAPSRVTSPTTTNNTPNSYVWSDGRVHSYAEPTGTGTVTNTSNASTNNTPNSYVWSDGRVHSYAEPTGTGTVTNTSNTSPVQGYTPGTAAPVNADIASLTTPYISKNGFSDMFSNMVLNDYNSSPGTNGLANTMSEKDFSNNDLMRETYGTYQNYKNGITVFQQQQQKANILGRLFGSNSDTTNAYSPESHFNKSPAFGGPVYDFPNAGKLIDWLKTDPAERIAEQTAQLGSDFSNLSPAQQWYIKEGKASLSPKAFSNSAAVESYINHKHEEDTETKKYNNINPKTGQPEKGSKNPSGLYAVSTDPKSGIWTDQFGNRWTSDGKEVLSEQEFNRGNMTEYNTGTKLPVVDASGNVVGSTYVDPVTGQPTNAPISYNNYLGYLQDKSAANALGENPMADALAKDGILPNSITNMYNTYNDYAPVLQALADAGGLGAVPESAIPNSGTGGTPNEASNGGAGGSSRGGGYYPSGGGGGTMPTENADTLYSLPEVGNYASQLMLNKMMPTGYDYDYNKRLDSRIGDLQAAQNAYVQSSIPLIARTYQDQAANSFANLLNTLRANRASGLTSGASRGAQAAQDVQAIQSANKENASSLNDLVNTNLAAYLQTLAGKRATSGSDTAGELQSYYSPMATALGEILAQYNYGSAAAQVNNGGLRRAQSYLV